MIQLEVLDQGSFERVVSVDEDASSEVEVREMIGLVGTLKDVATIPRRTRDCYISRLFFSYLSFPLSRLTHLFTLFLFTGP